MTMIRSPPSIKCINRESPKTQIAKFFLEHGILISCFLANLYFSKIGDPTNFDTFRPEPSFCSSSSQVLTSSFLLPGSLLPVANTGVLSCISFSLLSFLPCLLPPEL